MTRSLRRTLHARHEGQLVKAIAASQNLAVAEETWLVLREQGAMVEEAESDDELAENEKLVEKVGLALAARQDVEEEHHDEKVGLHELRPEDVVGSDWEDGVDSS